MRGLLVLSALLLSGMNVEAKDVEWDLDKSHTSVTFSVRHLGITKVKGSFHEFSAQIRGEPKTAHLTSLNATIEVGSVDTGIAKRDAHLKADDFFAAEKFPQMQLSIEKIEWKKDAFSGTIKLRLRDVTKSIAVQGELLGIQKTNFGKGEQLRAGYSVHFAINRKDFGLTFGALSEGVAIVGDRVEIEIDAQVFRSL